MNRENTFMIPEQADDLQTASQIVIFSNKCDFNTCGHLKIYEWDVEGEIMIKINCMKALLFWYYIFNYR